MQIATGGHWRPVAEAAWRAWRAGQLPWVLAHGVHRLPWLVPLAFSQGEMTLATTVRRSRALLALLRRSLTTDGYLHKVRPVAWRQRLQRLGFGLRQQG